MRNLDWDTPLVCIGVVIPALLLSIRLERQCPRHGIVVPHLRNDDGQGVIISALAALRSRVSGF